MEIDLAFKVEEILFVVECKGASVSLGVEMDIVHWYLNMRENAKLTRLKGIILEDCIQKKLVDHSLFEGATKFVPLILKTEGMTSYFGVFPPEMYENYLKSMREAIDSGTIRKFLKERLVDYSDKEDFKKKLASIRELER